MLSTDEAIDIMADCGNKRPLANIGMEGKEKLIRLAVLHFSILCIKAELDQLIAGLELLCQVPGLSRSERAIRQLSRETIEGLNMTGQPAEKINQKNN